MEIWGHLKWLSFYCQYLDHRFLIDIYLISPGNEQVLLRPRIWMSMPSVHRMLRITTLFPSVVLEDSASLQHRVSSALLSAPRHPEGETHDRQASSHLLSQIVTAHALLQVRNNKGIHSCIGYIPN